MLYRGTNTRFLVSNRNERPEELYDPYVRRSKAEEWIKDFNAESRPVERFCAS